MLNDNEVSKVELFEKFVSKHGGYVMINSYLRFYELIYHNMHIGYQMGDRSIDPYFYIARNSKCNLSFTIKAKRFSLGETFGTNLDHHKYKNYTIMASENDLPKIQMILNDPRISKYDSLLEKYPISMENNTMMIYRKFPLYMATLTLDTLEKAVDMFEQIQEIIDYYTTQF